MHVLLIPSEEFIPPHNKLDGIFQYHQAVILKESGHRVGVLSVRLSFSVPMIAKGIAMRFFGKKTGNETDKHSILSLVKLGFNKVFRPQHFVHSETIDGLTVFRVDGLFLKPPKDNKNHLSWIRAGLACFEEYQKKEGVPDVIHAHNAIYAGMLAAEIKRRYGLRYILTEHSSTYAMKKLEGDIVHLVKKAYDGASGLIAVSQAFADLLNKLFSFQRFHYLPNVLDQQLEKFPYKPIATNGNKFIFLHIAVLLPVKDQATLLQAFQLVVRHNPAAELWIGGNGELLDTLRRQAESLQIQDSVKFLGLLNREEVINRIQACDCFVLSSKYETFGVVVIEAMLFGKPVIVTRCGVGQSLVDEKIGYVVDVGDAEKLAGAMQKMMNTSSSYDPEHIRRVTIDQFGKDAFVRKINKIYSEVVSPLQNPSKRHLIK